MSYANSVIKSQQAGGAFTLSTLPTATQMLGESVGTIAYTTDGGLQLWNGSSWVGFVASSVFDKIRTSKARAEAKNRFTGTGLQVGIEHPALQPAANWAASTVYYYGQAVTNGVNTYLSCGNSTTPGAGTSGTSAASGGPTGTGDGVVTDGSVLWYYAGLAPTAVTEAPTITVSTTNPSATYPTLFSPVGVSGFANTYNFKNNSFFITKGGPSISQATSSVANGYWYTSPSGVGQQPAEIEFVTDAPSFVIASYCVLGYGWTIFIDDVLANPGVIMPTTGATNNYFKIAFTERKQRKISILTDGSSGAPCTFAGVYLDNASKCYAPLTNIIKAHAVGDSMEAGSGYYPILRSHTFFRRMAGLLGIESMSIDGFGGTGFVNPGAGTIYGSSQRVANAVSMSPQLLMFRTSQNDISYTPTQITSAMLLTLQAYRAALPNAPIFLFGCWGVNNNSATAASANMLALENASYAAFQSFNDANSYWIPNNLDTNGPWMTGNGKNGSTTGIGNADAYVAPDGAHTSWSGGIYLAQRMASAVATIIDNSTTY